MKKAFLCAVALLVSVSGVYAADSNDEAGKSQASASSSSEEANRKINAMAHRLSCEDDLSDSANLSLQERTLRFETAKSEECIRWRANRK